MEVLIIAVFLGLGFAYFAIQNPITVPISIFYYHSSIPLFFVAIGSLLTGLCAAWIMNFFGGWGTSLTLRKQSHRIEEDTRAINGLRNRIHTLEGENERLRGEKPSLVINPQNTHERPSLFQKIRHAF